MCYNAIAEQKYPTMLYWKLAGKIAASSGHASWVSGKSSRGRVFELRGRSDAIIVGGNTVRLDGIDWIVQSSIYYMFYILLLHKIE